MENQPGVAGAASGSGFGFGPGSGFGPGVRTSRLSLDGFSQEDLRP